MISLLVIAVLQSAPATAGPRGREEFAIVIDDSAPSLEGRGRSQRVGFQAPSGPPERWVVHAWATSDAIDPVLRAEDEQGAKLAEDEDSGGGTAAFLRVELAAGAKLRLCVAAERLEELGTANVVVIPVAHLAPEAQTRCDEAVQLLDASERAWKSKAHAEARTQLRAAITALIAQPSEGDVLAAEVDAALDRAATLAAVMQDSPSARDAWRRVLQSREITFPADHGELQRARLGVGVALVALGEVGPARTLFEAVEAVRARLLPPDHPELLLVRANLGMTLFRAGEFAASRAILETVLSSYVRTLPPDDPEIQRAQLNLASTAHAMGDLVLARELAERVYAVRKRTLPADHTGLQTSGNNLAAIRSTMGDLAGAHELFELVLESRTRTLDADHPELQRARSNLALCRKQLGDLRGARELQAAVVDVFQRTLPAEDRDLALARSNLASTMAELGELDDARTLHEALLVQAERAHPDMHPSVEQARMNVAATIKQLGELPRALELEERVLEHRARTLPNDHPQLQLTRVSLAYTLASLAARSGKSLASSTDERAAWRARYLEVVRQFLGALRDFCRTTLLTSSAREAEERIATFKRIDVALSLACGVGVFDSDPQLEEQAFLLSETMREVSLLSARIARAAGSSSEWSTLRARHGESAARLAALTRSGGAPEEIARVRDDIEGVQRELVRLGGQADPATMTALDVDAGALARRLDADEALVAYRSYKRVECDSNGGTKLTASMCAYVLRAGEAPVRIELGASAPIHDAVAGWLGAIGVRGDTEPTRGVPVEPSRTSGAADADGSAVRDLVFTPLERALRGAKHVWIVPDDVLHVVPFDALPAGEALLGDASRLERRSSALELLFEDARSAGEGSCFLMGGVDFEATSQTAPAAMASVLRGGDRGSGFAALPGTSEEVRGIAQLAGSSRKTDLIEGADASRATLEELAPRARWLHIATHGWFAPESVSSWNDSAGSDGAAPGGTGIRGLNPMLLCGLALAGANRPADELGRVPGLITAEEMSALDLARCELAVLSACDTNVGEQRAGQGVASLQRALHMAGARSVITSLWKVPDEATKELMLDFYRRLWVEKKPKWQALWEAKKKLRDAKDERGKPKYTTRDWAAWVLTGDPD